MARAAAPSTKPVAKRSTATDKVTKKTVRGKPSGSKAATVKKATQTAAVSREANAKDATVSDTSASKQTRSADVSDPNLSSNTTPSQSKLVSTKKDGSTIAGAAQTVNSLDHVNDEHAPPKAPVRKDDMPEKTAAASPVGTKNKRAPLSRTPMLKRTIPRSYDECDTADKTLLDMRDAGSDWAAINTELERMLGGPCSKSTLPNRYSRLKMNFVVIDEKDNLKIVEAHREINDAFEATKWQKVAELVKSKGGAEYTHEACHLQYKRLMLLGTAMLAGRTLSDDEEQGDNEGGDRLADREERGTA